MKISLYANRVKPNPISVISILLPAEAGSMYLLHCVDRERYICACIHVISHIYIYYILPQIRPKSWLSWQALMD